MSWTPFTVEVPAGLPRLLRQLRLAAYGAATVLIVMGGSTLVGWSTATPWLKEPLGGGIPMMPNTALLLSLSGVSLALSMRGSPVTRWAANVLSTLSIAFALTTLAEDVTGGEFGIDQLLLDVHPARPAVSTSVALVLSSTGLLLRDLRARRGPALAEILAVGSGIIASFTLGGFLYGAIQFYVSSRHPHAVGMAVNTSIGLLVLAGGILASRPDSGAMATFTSSYVGGQVARKMLLIALLIPALGYAAVRAQHAALYQPPGAAVVTGVAGMVVSIAITYAVARSLDRTDAERRRVEQETREWKRFFDRAAFGAAFGTPDGRFLRVNEAFARMHGCTPAELEGTPIIDTFAPAQRGEVAEKVRMTHELGHHRWESEHVRKDGSTFPVIIDLSAVRDDRGKLLYRAAYMQDISEEKKAEAVRARLASLVQSADDAIVAKTLDGIVLDWNHGAERVYGYTARDIVGCSIKATVPEDRLDEREALHQRVRAGETVIGFETERLRKDGARIPIALTLSPIRDGAGRVVGISTIERDISTLKALERERQEWASIVAHDLRQPTATIRLVTDMLARTEGASGKTAIDRIRRATDRLERMTQDLLDVSRIEARRLTVHPRPVSLASAIAEVVEGTPEVVSRCRTEITPDAVRASVDMERFVQVLSNLLSNAAKYGTPDTPIDVRVERTGDMVQITVTNEGAGIAPDEIPKLFSRFARTRSAQAGRAPGLGLGLYICRGIVEAHGGKLWVESVPGSKTHFRFTLPRAPALGDEHGAAQPSPALRAS